MYGPLIRDGHFRRSGKAYPHAFRICRYHPSGHSAQDQENLPLEIKVVGDIDSWMIDDSMPAEFKAVLRKFIVEMVQLCTQSSIPNRSRTPSTSRAKTRISSYSDELAPSAAEIRAGNGVTIIYSCAIWVGNAKLFYLVVENPWCDPQARGCITLNQRLSSRACRIRFFSLLFSCSDAGR